MERPFHTPRGHARFFVEHMLKLGAEDSALEAALAGGALVGPLSPLDMHLDLGGRTSEMVLALWAITGHPGGSGGDRRLSGCRMQLICPAWTCPYLRPCNWLKNWNPRAQADGR